MDYQKQLASIRRSNEKWLSKETPPKEKKRYKTHCWQYSMPNIATNHKNLIKKSDE